MKAPIEPEEIVGREVRVNDGGTTARVVAYTRVPSYLLEFEDGSRQLRQEDGFKFEPAVELPTVPTLGWATFGLRGTDRTEVCLAMWADERMRPSCEHGGASGGDPEWVRAFVPATAVPTDALRALEAAITSDSTHGALCLAVGAFLGEVNKAASA